MNLRRVIPADITASAAVHLLLLALVFVFSEVRPFGTVTTVPIAVDVVSSQEVAEKQAAVEDKSEPVTPPPPLPDLSPTERSAESPPAAAPPPSPVSPPKQATKGRPSKQASAAAAPKQEPAASKPVVQQAEAPQPQPQVQPEAPAYKPPEPDLSIKYHVILGLPRATPPLPSGDKRGDNFDDRATKKADIASNLVAEFRQHLKTCSKLPDTLSGTDDIRLVLRISLTPDGRLAADPILIEASASMKGPLLMRSAIDALKACQPYNMLPADRYREWKVIDLGFTPQDFS